MPKSEGIKKIVLKKLSEVNDPELGIDIVSLGLVYGVEVDEKNKKVEVKITFTTPACPLLGFILDNVKSKLEEIKEWDFYVDVVWDPPWSPEKMKPEARKKLGL
ncbi:MAG: metal-sulfur cluster assembly factor [Candidatus Anstonellales archaeon]